MTSPTSLIDLVKEQRRVWLSRSPRLCGIDYVRAAPEGRGRWQLGVFFIEPDPSVQGKSPVPPGISASSIYIHTQRGSAAPLEVESVEYPPDSGNILTIWLMERLQAGPYLDELPDCVLEIRNVPLIDRFFSTAAFSLNTHVIANTDPLTLPYQPQEAGPDVRIDYLSKDYASFKRLILDYLSLLSPQWTERNPADLGIMLVETLAYAADYLSYYQDAVATEAYLGTARTRVSVKRHARLLDYHMHEGCNARVWLHFDVDAEGVALSQGTPVLTKLSGYNMRVPTVYYNEQMSVRQHRARVFETMHEARLYQSHNKISLYTWGAREYYLEKGATSATLRGHYPSLKSGDVLVLEEVLGPVSGLPQDMNVHLRHPIRLSCEPDLSHDPLTGQEITEIVWRSEDALPFRMVLASLTRDGDYATDVTVARGNIVLADYGKTISDEQLSAIAEGERYNPKLTYPEITYAVHYDHAQAHTRSASQALVQLPQEAMPCIRLREYDEEGRDTGEVWTPRRDLLSSEYYDKAFVVEPESDGTIFLRFGDGVQGAEVAPGTSFKATYRINNGPDGNIGPEIIGHVVTDDGRITGVRNLLPAQGGVSPEHIEKVRMNAPYAFKTQRRCVTAEDYASASREHPEVKNAIASMHWTGSWYTVFIYVDRRGHKEIDARFRQDLLELLEPRRHAGFDIEIYGPRYVPLYISITAYIAEGASAGQVRKSLLERFSNTDNIDSSRGFFHPDNFTFGKPLFLSQVVSAAMGIDGVRRVEVTRFQRWGHEPQGELASGELSVGPLEIARLDNDPLAPEHGVIEFDVREQV